jgi:hypothetical protein
VPYERHFSCWCISCCLLDRGPQLQTLDALGFDVNRNAVENNVWGIWTTCELHATPSGAFSKPKQLSELGGTFSLAPLPLLP